MSRKGTLSLASLMGLFLLVTAVAFPADQPPESRITQLAIMLKSDPAKALEETLKLKEAFAGKKEIMQRIALLQGKALLGLSRFSQAEEILRPLLEQLIASPEPDSLLLTRTAFTLGQVLAKQSRPTEAEAALKLALSQVSPENAAELRGDILVELTRSLIMMGEPVNAADNATEALEWAREHGLESTALKARFLLAYAYRNLEDTKKARHHFQLALAAARHRKNFRYEVMSMNELGNILVMEKKFDEAMTIKKAALDRARQTKEEYLITICMHDIGYALISKREFTPALALFQECLTRGEVTKNPRAMAMARTNIAYIYSQTGKPDLALKLSYQTLEIARQHKLGEIETNILTQIIDVLSSKGRYHEALIRRQELDKLQSEKFKRELDRKVSEIQSRHHLMEKESEIRILKQDREIRNLQLGRQRILTASMIALAISFALLAGLALYGYRAKRRANQELQSLNIRLDDLSRSDPLTGLSNRRDMLEKLQLLQARANREKSPLALLMIDMDGFKSINDTLGHNQGDRVLRQVARALRSRTRGQDLLARWGGEEFLVALSGADRNAAFKAAEKYRKTVEELELPPKHPRITITIGLAIYNADEDVQKTITRADNHLYAGKQAGRNRVVG